MQMWKQPDLWKATNQISKQIHKQDVGNTKTKNSMV